MLKFLTVAASLCVAPLPSLAAAAPDAPAIISNAVSGFVRPAYHNFHAVTARLKTATAQLCAEPSPAALDASKNAFGETVKAWSRAEIIRFGPVTEQHRLERILFWPDRKSTGLKQVQAAIEKHDETATDPAALAGKSVAMQGLGALEFVLYGTESETLANGGGSYRCAFGASIAANLDKIAGEIEDAWNLPDGFAKDWTEPGDGNPFYRNDAEALGELLDVFVTGLELDRDVRIGGFLGETPDQDKPKQALFWRSQQTANMLAGNLEGMKALFEASGLGAALPSEFAWIAKSIIFEFDNAARALEAADGPLSEVLADPDRRGKLDYVRVVTSSLSDLFGTRLSAEFGLTSGFSSLDGD